MTQQDLFTQAATTPEEADPPIPEETTREATPIILNQLTLNQWHFCVKVNAKVLPAICEARKVRGRCVTQEKTQGRGKAKVTISTCEPKKSKSDRILEIAVDGRTPEQTTQEGEE